MFLRHLWKGEPTIINGRITKVNIGKHEFRDSYKLLPVALKNLGTGKKEIDYNKLEAAIREKHKDEILHYMRADCLSLYSAIREFIDEFGFNLTIGSAAIKELNRFHTYTRLSMAIDGEIRPFFFGGRNQCFETGVLRGAWKIYDVNSMYPHVMRDFKHPVGEPWCYHNKVTPRTAFIRLRARNYGALPFRGETGLDFTHAADIYNCTVHEYHAGLETGTLEPIEILQTLEFKQWSSFADFVDWFYAKRLWAKEAKIKSKDTFYKLVLNNAYGKFATDPANFFDYTISEDIPTPQCDKRPKCHVNCGQCYWLEDEIVRGTYLWRKPCTPKSWQYYNVATGASITGAARATLLRALARAERPIYCDTDSIICLGLDADLDPARLGAWKLEAEGNEIAIAGKKTYALLNGGKLVKKASKGVDLTPAEIFSVARGETVEYANPVPKFKLNGKTIFMTRKIKATAQVNERSRVGKRKG